MRWLLLLIFLCLLSFSMGWHIMGAIILAFFIIVALLLVFVNNEEKKKQEEINRINAERAIRKQVETEAKIPLYNAARDRLLTKYGEPTKTIILKELSLEKEIIVFEQANRVWICGKDLSMKEILSCSFSDTPKIVKGKVTHETKTNEGNMVKRAVVGNVILGEAGAIIGGSTASKTTTTTQEADKVYHHYTIVINIDSLSDPILRIDLGDDEKTVNEIVGLMNVIINRNN